MPILQVKNEPIADRLLRGWEEEAALTSHSLNGLQVSEELYWQEYYDHADLSYEWVNGRLEEKPVSTIATYLMYKWLLNLLDYFLETFPVGKTAALETGFRVKLSPASQRKVSSKKKKRKHKGDIRRPDFALVLNDNPVPLLLDGNRYDGVFDLCVEAISLSTKKAKERDTIQKKEEYELSGVPEYYILDDSGKNLAFYHLDQWGLYKDIIPIDGDIIQSQLLPGFCFRISDLYKRPTLEEMVEDELYRHFVFPAYSRLKQRAEEEKQAKQEAQRLAEKERQAKEEERRAKEDALLQVEEERRAKEEALMQLEKERKEKEELLKKLAELGISLE